jgi:hypothetical protein
VTERSRFVTKKFIGTVDHACVHAILRGCGFHHKRDQGLMVLRYSTKGKTVGNLWLYYLSSCNTVDYISSEIILEISFTKA